MTSGAAKRTSSLERLSRLSLRGRLAPMRLKQAILRVMGRDPLKRAVQGLDIDDVDRRSVQSMSTRLSRARRATPEYLLEFLSEQDLKDVCELLDVSATGRRRTLASRLLAAAGRSGRSPGSKPVAAGQPEPAGKANSGRGDSPQVIALPPRDFGKRASDTLYTVGCNGIREPAEMADVLLAHGVDVLVDVRWKPYARTPKFNKKKLEHAEGPMKSVGLDYLHNRDLGNDLVGTGGRRIHNPAVGLKRLSDELKGRVVAIMCQCGPPEECHRSDVARMMTERMPGLRIEHLRSPSQA